MTVRAGNPQRKPAGHAAQQGQRVCKALPAQRPRSHGRVPAIIRPGLVHHVAERVDRDQRGHNQPTAQFDRGAADAGLGSMPCTEQLAHAAPGPRADVALDHRRIRGGQAGRVAHLGIGPGDRAADRQVEQDRRRHNRDAPGPALTPTPRSAR